MSLIHKVFHHSNRLMAGPVIKKMAIIPKKLDRQGINRL